MKYSVTPYPTTPARIPSAMRDALMPALTADSADEYTFRMLVAIGPWSTINMTRMATNPPKTSVTSRAGSAVASELAIVAPRMASHTVGMNIPQ